MAAIKIEVEMSLKSDCGTITIRTPDIKAKYKFSGMKTYSTRGSHPVESESWIEHVPDDEIVHHLDIADAQKVE